MIDRLLMLLAALIATPALAQEYIPVRIPFPDSRNASPQQGAAQALNGLRPLPNSCTLSGGQLQCWAEAGFPPQVFASLAACSVVNWGNVAVVNDSDTSTLGATIAGGGAEVVVAFCDAINWIVIGN